MHHCNISKNSKFLLIKGLTATIKDKYIHIIFNLRLVFYPLNINGSIPTNINVRLTIMMNYFTCRQNMKERHIYFTTLTVGVLTKKFVKYKN